MGSLPGVRTNLLRAGGALVIVPFLILFVAYRERIWRSHAWQNAGMIALNQARSDSADTPQERDLVAAEQRLQQALALTENRRAARRALAFTLALQGKEEPALALFRQLDGSAQALRQWGDNAWKSNTLNEALLWYREGGRLEPEVGDWLFYQGLVYAEMARWQEAEGALRQALSLPRRQIGRSDVYYQLGRVTTGAAGPDAAQVALADFDAAIVADDFGVQTWKIDAHFQQGEMLRALGRQQEAMSAYEWVTVHDPRHYWAHVQLGNYYWQQGDVTTGEALLQRATTINPENKWAYRLLAQLYDATDRRQEALASYKKVIQLDPGDELARKRVADLQSDSK